MPRIQNDWLAEIGSEFQEEYYLKLRRFLMQEYRNEVVYPRADDLFNAYHYTPYAKVKVLILGQDPYHGENQAHGLCFSVKKGVQIPPSLVNIYKELQEDLDFTPPKHGYLKQWADEGVFLLNTVLSVRKGMPQSHAHQGWERFTDASIRAINRIDRPLVVMLWGRPAQMKSSLLDNPKHLVLKASHPSPLSAYRGFFGCRHFSKCNQFLVEHGVEPVRWQIG